MGGRVSLIALSFCSCRNLMYLNLSFCEHISDTGIELLAQLTSLVDLDVTGCGLSDQVRATPSSSN